MTGMRWLPVVLAFQLVFSACGGQSTPTPTPAASPAPSADLPASSGAVLASAKVVPARTAELSFPAAGRVEAVNAGEGEQVQAGAVLVAQDSAEKAAAAARARAALFQAQARLAELQAGPRTQEIAAAQARVDASQARLAQLSEGTRPEEIAAARADVGAAQAALQQLYAGPREEERISALAALANARAALQQAQSAYDRVSSRADVGMLSESRALQEATNDYEAAQARYDLLYAAPDPDVVAAAQARVQQAQSTLAQLQTPGSANQIAEAEAQVRSAQAELDLLTVGVRDETLAAAAGAVAEAEAVLQQAEVDLVDTELRAPFTGTVTALQVNPGEMVLAGQVLLTLADLAHLQVETTDLSEVDVAQVAVGQPVVVIVEPLGVEIQGRVARIAPQANVIGGDVVYAVVIELDSQPAGLRWGMSAEVEILTE